MAGPREVFAFLGFDSGQFGKPLRPLHLADATAHVSARCLALRLGKGIAVITLVM